MNAVASHVVDVQPVEMFRMRQLLTRWGVVCERVRRWHGYPTADTTYRAQFGRGGEGRRIPLCDIPSFATRLSNELLKLPQVESDAITLWYCWHFSADGRWLTAADKGRLIGVSGSTLRDRELSGRRSLIIACKDMI
jgi:hypothetical protein